MNDGPSPGPVPGHPASRSPVPPRPELTFYDSLTEHMNTVPTLMSSEGLFEIPPAAPRIVSSAAHGWHGTLVVDITGVPAGEARQDHVCIALQQVSEPISVRPLRGPGGWRTIPSGCRIWLPGEEQHFEWRGLPQTTFVLITNERIEQILETPYSRVNAGFEAWRGLHFRSPFVSRLLAAMVDDIENDCAAGTLVGDSLTTALVAHVAIGPRPLSVVESRSAPSSQAFRRALEYVDANLTHPLRMAELAKVADCSQKQLSRAFRERKGMLPHDYVLALRVERARLLIGAGHLTLAQVAAAAGFADQSQMTKIFKKLLGTTPGRLRRGSSAALRLEHANGEIG
jgi:AraC-like DNA-binding protein